MSCYVDKNERGDEAIEEEGDEMQCIPVEVLKTRGKIEIRHVERGNAVHHSFIFITISCIYT